MGVLVVEEDGWEMSLQLKDKQKYQVIRNVGEEAATDSSGLRIAL